MVGMARFASGWGGGWLVRLWGGAVLGRESAVYSIPSPTARRGQGSAGVVTRPDRGNLDTLWHRPALTGPFPGTIGEHASVRSSVRLSATRRRGSVKL
jgi:hypothetical protein